MLSDDQSHDEGSSGAPRAPHTVNPPSYPLPPLVVPSDLQHVAPATGMHTLEAVRHAADELFTQPNIVSSDDESDKDEEPPEADQMEQAMQHSMRTDHSSGGEGMKRKGSAHSSHEYTAFQAAFHVFKGNVGAAIFSLSRAYRYAGFVMGTIIVASLALICVFCMLVLVECKQRINEPTVQTYGQVAHKAFGKHGKRWVDIFLVVTQLGFCCVYFQFVANVMTKVVPPVSSTAWIIIMLPIAAALTFLPNMKKLVPVAMFATFSTCVALLVIYGYSLKELGEDGAHSTIVPAASIWAWPICIGNVVSAFEGIGLVLPIENSMRVKPAFPKLLVKTFMIITVLYASFALIGYLAFGDDMEENAMAILPEGWLSGLIRVMMGLAILFTYPIQFFPAIQVIESWVFHREARYMVLQGHVKMHRSLLQKAIMLWRNLALRIVISVVLAVLAFAVGDKMSLCLAVIGGLGGSALAIILPPLLHLKVIVFAPSSDPSTRSTLVIVRDCALASFGVAMMALSTFFSIKQFFAGGGGEAV
eukprot:Sspe_Gene.13727::Locus_4715_Transcript_1_1_Confidence_1.000_Length_1729::g.13727::m.13727/K14209/SLC36A, PAT; solute carrier family 36 (proton-coupled amino acid transporter)